MLGLRAPIPTAPQISCGRGRSRKSILCSPISSSFPISRVVAPFPFRCSDSDYRQLRADRGLTIWSSRTSRRPRPGCASVPSTRSRSYPDSSPSSLVDCEASWGHPPREFSSPGLFPESLAPPDWDSPHLLGPVNPGPNPRTHHLCQAFPWPRPGNPQGPHGLANLDVQPSPFQSPNCRHTAAPLHPTRFCSLITRPLVFHVFPLKKSSSAGKGSRSKNPPPPASES